MSGIILSKMATIGKQIQKIRLLNKLTQKQLAKKASVTYVTLTKIEGGSIKNPTITTVARLASALCVSIDALYQASIRTGDLSRCIQQYKSLVDNSPDVVTRFDTKLRLLYVNPSGLKHTGKKETDLNGKTPLEAGFPKSMAAPFEKALRRALATGEEYRFSTYFKGPRGLLRFDNHLIPEFGHKNKVVSILNFAHSHPYRQ